MRRRTARPLAVAALFALLAGSPLVAQMPAPRPTRHCFMGRPALECRSFWVYTLSYHKPFLATRVPDPGGRGFGPRDMGPYVSVELGPMWRRTESSALGVTILHAPAIRPINYEERWGVHARYRQWLRPGHTVDVGLGAVRVETFRQAHGVGVSAFAGYNWRELIGAKIGAEVVPIGNETATALFAGVSIHSKVALLGTIVGLASWFLVANASG